MNRHDIQNMNIQNIDEVRAWARGLAKFGGKAAERALRVLAAAEDSERERQGDERDPKRDDVRAGAEDDEADALDDEAKFKKLIASLKKKCAEGDDEARKQMEYARSIGLADENGDYVSPEDREKREKSRASLRAAMGLDPAEFGVGRDARGRNFYGAIPVSQLVRKGR